MKDSIKDIAINAGLVLAIIWGVSKATAQVEPEPTDAEIATLRNTRMVTHHEPKPTQVLPSEAEPKCCLALRERVAELEDAVKKKSLLTAPATPAPAVTPAPEETMWGASYGEALNSARESGGLVLLYVTSQTCGECQRMEQVLTASDLAGYSAVKVDADMKWCTDLGCTTAAVALRADSYPYFVIIDPRRHIVVWRGNVDKDSFRGVLD